MKSQVIFKVLFFLAIFSSCKKDTAFIIPFKFDIPFDHKYAYTAVNADENLTVRILKIEDSRCPQNVKCIWQGEARITLELIKNNVKISEFVLSERAGSPSLADSTIDQYKISLLEANPYPVHPNKILLTDYSVKLTISKIQH